MTDYAELVKRWRVTLGTTLSRMQLDRVPPECLRVYEALAPCIDEAADAIEAQAARIAELERDLQRADKRKADLCLGGAKIIAKADVAESETAKLRERIAELERERDKYITEGGRLMTDHVNLKELFTAAESEARLAERQAIEQRLRRPDPDFRHTVAMAKHSRACDGGYSIVGGPAAEAAMFAIADVLFPPSKEGE